MADTYERGGWWIVDDRSGERIRARDAVKEWDGSIVHKDDWEARHPQEFVRAKADKQSVSPVRTEPDPTFVGPQETALTAAAIAGATSLTVASTSGFSAADPVRLLLETGMFSTTVSSVDSATAMTLAAALPGPAAIGIKVIRAVAAAPNIG